MINLDLPPQHHVSVGYRGELGDPSAVHLGAKLTTNISGNASVSIRPSLLIGDYIEARSSVTLNLESKVSPYVGFGVAYNVDELNTFDPLITTGVDIDFNERLGLAVQTNLIFQDNDTDTEFLIGPYLRF